jgi:hypothetical protein
MRPALVTVDVYMALLDIEGGLAQHVAQTLALGHELATAFVKQWRAQQMLGAAASTP